MDVPVLDLGTKLQNIHMGNVLEVVDVRLRENNRGDTIVTYTLSDGFKRKESVIKKYWKVVDAPVGP